MLGDQRRADSVDLIGVRHGDTVQRPQAGFGSLSETYLHMAAGHDNQVDRLGRGRRCGRSRNGAFLGEIDMPRHDVSAEGRGTRPGEGEDAADRRVLFKHVRHRRADPSGSAGDDNRQIRSQTAQQAVARLKLRPCFAGISWVV